MNSSIAEVIERSTKTHGPAYGTELKKQNYQVFLQPKVPTTQKDNLKKARGSENVQKILDGIRPNAELEI